MLILFLVALFGFILMNVPIAFALVLTSIVLSFFFGSFSPALLAQNIVRGIDNFPIMAIPFFLLAGEIMNYGGISKRIVAFAQTILGHIRGGLGYVTVLASMLFAGVSGSAVADTSAMGSLLYPVMEKEGYNREKARPFSVQPVRSAPSSLPASP